MTRQTTVRRLVVTAALCAAALVSVLCPAAAQAACSTANPASNFSAPTDFTTDQGIDQAFTAARAAEGCSVPLVVPAGYDAMTAQQQQLWLFNNEREVRGLPDLSLDPTLLSQIASNHSKEMATYGYTDHPSPINAPLGQPVSGRLFINPILANSPAWGEDIVAGFPTAAAGVFWYMYQDSASNWGHRDNILGNFNWVGIGALPSAPGAKFQSYYTDDFLLNPGYQPPATADTGAPVTGPLSYANGVATLTGVADSPSNVNDTTDCIAAVAGTPLSQSGWSATTNTNAGGGDAVANAFDGDLTTRFSSDATQAPGQELTVNLGAPQTFDELNMQVPNSSSDYARGYTVATSPDGTTWTPAVTCTGAGTPEVASFPTVTAQYVRITLTASNPTWWWSIDELSLYAPAAGITSATVPISDVVFYTNAIVENTTNQTFNTVQATQTPAGSGTWTAPITVNPGDVLHAVAVDGSGNFTDVTMTGAPPVLNSAPPKTKSKHKHKHTHKHKHKRRNRHKRGKRRRNRH